MRHIVRVLYQMLCEADGEDAFPGSGNPVANKDHETLKLKKENEGLRKEVAILKKFRAFLRQAQA